MKYEKFKNIFNETIFEESKAVLIGKIAKYPNISNVTSGQKLENIDGLLGFPIIVVACSSVLGQTSLLLQNSFNLSSSSESIEVLIFAFPI